MTVCIFSGQGSQIKGMGAGLFIQFPQLTQQANDLLGYSIEELCLEDPKQQLNQTQFTQPALYVVNALIYLNYLNQSEKKPNYLAGHSLGEYNALWAAEVFDFATGLKLTQKRGKLMSQATNGGMLAIVGLPAITVNAILAENFSGELSVANYNSYTQVVVSGVTSAIERAIPLFEQAGASMVKLLKTSGAFHSPLMYDAELEFVDFLAGFVLSSPVIPVLSNYTARPYQLENIKENLTRQISHPVRWTESMSYLLNQGEEVFEEIGPGKILAGLMRRIKNGQ